MPLSVKTGMDRWSSSPKTWRAGDGLPGEGDPNTASVLEQITRDPALMSEVEQLLAGRTRDIRLKGKLAQAYRQRSWRQTAKIIRAWMLWVAILNVFLFGLNLLLLPLETALATLVPSAVLMPAALLVAFIWRKPHSQRVLGITLLTGMLLILLSVCGVGLASGSDMLERNLHIMLLVAITGVIIFAIPMAQTIAIAVSAMGLYVVFQLSLPDASVWKSLSGIFFFASGIAATVVARRTMNILAYKSFLLELRDRHHMTEMAHTNRRLERLSRTDGLTGVANRHFLGEKLEELARQGRHVAVLMCDIDHFKALNDELGHLEGDRCLAEVARIIMECTGSPEGCVARYGGEEFLVLLPDASEAEAIAIAENIREAVAAAALPNPGSSVKPTVTLSIGLAVGELRNAWRAAEAVQKRADAALYAAKRDGRDRIQPWHEDIETARKLGSAA